MSTQDMLPLILGLASILWALWNLTNIARAEKVTGYLEGYEEEYVHDADPAQSGTRYAPVYSYTYGGFTRRYRSRNLVGVLSAQFMHKNSKNLYVAANGKVYEMTTVYSFLLIGIAVIVIGMGIL